MSTDTMPEWLADTRINGAHRRFFVCRLGQSGSTWFAKLLNSHPEVFCSHERILGNIHPQTGVSMEDQHRLIQWYASDTQHETYKAVGDIGSLDLFLAVSLPRDIFQIGMLMRHPLNQIHTRMNVIHHDPSELVIDDKRLATEFYIKRDLGIDASKHSELDRYFLVNTWFWHRQFERAREMDTVIQVERLNEVEYAQQVLQDLTGVHYESALLERALAKRENARAKKVASTKEAFDQFTPQQQEWYRFMVNDLAEEFGYSI